jgi:hypothetical protein
MSTETFYQHIPYFSHFSEFTDDRHFQRVPSDWSVVLTDVKGSTVAIEKGRYKDVNRIGAAAIACAQKAMEGLDFPYVFGGDGATLVVPPASLEAVCRALTALQALSEKRFKLGLRVGTVPVATLEAAGFHLEVARFEIASGRCIAIFRGGALAAAEKMIKGDEARYGVTPAQGGKADLDELSCRWNAVPASRGRAVSLIVQARGADAAATYRKVLKGLERIMTRGLDEANPIHLSSMSYRSWWACVRDEARHFNTVWSKPFFQKLLGITVSVASLRWGIKPYFYDPKAYTKSIPAHSDYRKFDDALRLIIDCEQPQIAPLNAFLDGLYREGEIYYGVRVSDLSLITCYVRSTAPGEHIHFVDGGDGGYAMAAKQMKAQMKGSPPA